MTTMTVSLRDDIADTVPGTPSLLAGTLPAPPPHPQVLMAAASRAAASLPPLLPGLHPEF